MPGLSAIDAALAPLWAQVRAAQAGRAVYHQCLESHSALPQDATETTCDRASAKPHYQASGWAGVGGLPATLPCSVKIDQYRGPQGAGYAMTAEANLGGERWRRVLHEGPEAGWEREWERVGGDTDATRQDLRIYWRFDGDSRDLSGWGNHLTPVNSPTWAEGLVGQAAVLNGINQRFDCPVARGMDNLDAFTGICWIWLAELSRQHTFFLVLTEHITNFIIDLVYYHVAQRIRGHVRDLAVKAVSFQDTQLGVPPVETWLCVRFWRDPAEGTWNLQINDLPRQSTPSTTGLLQSVNPYLIIGSNDNVFGGPGITTSHFWGRLGPMMFWRRVLTDAEAGLLRGRVAAGRWPL